MRPIVFALCLFALPAQAACIRPLIGSEPVLPIEQEQPTRLARDPHVVPGLDGLVVRAMHRDWPNRYEITRAGYRQIPSDWPLHRSPQVRSDSYLRQSDGRLLAIANGGRTAWRLSAGQQTWDLAAETENSSDILFDYGTGRAYARFDRFDPLEEITADGLMPGPGLPGDPELPEYVVGLRTVPEISGTLASLHNVTRNETSLWFRPDGGNWSTTGLNLRISPTGSDKTFRTHFDGELLRIFSRDWPGFRLSTLKLTGNRLVPLADGPSQDWARGPRGTWITWDGDRSQLVREERWLRPDRIIEPVPPVLKVLIPGRAWPVTLDGVTPAVQSDLSSRYVQYDLRRRYLERDDSVVL